MPHKAGEDAWYTCSLLDDFGKQLGYLYAYINTHILIHTYILKVVLSISNKISIVKL